MVTINKLYNKFQLEILIKQNFNGNNLNKLAGESYSKLQFPVLLLLQQQLLLLHVYQIEVNSVK